MDWEISEYFVQNAPGMTIPPELISFVQEQFCALETKVDDSCVGNYRWCEKGSAMEVAYCKAAAHGCCGFEDIEVEHKGKTYLFGCNYGH